MSDIGSDRRHGSAEMAAMLARIDERTAAMKESMEGLATKESLEHVCTELARHIEDHKAHAADTKWKVGTWIAAALGLAGLSINLFGKKAP